MFSETIESAIGMPGGAELMLILLIVTVLFGAKRIPKLGSALGEGMSNFRKAFSGKETPEPARIEPPTDQA